MCDDGRQSQTQETALQLEALRPLPTEVERLADGLRRVEREGKEDVRLATEHAQVRRNSSMLSTAAACDAITAVVAMEVPAAHAFYGSRL